MLKNRPVTYLGAEEGGNASAIHVGFGPQARKFPRRIGKHVVRFFCLGHADFHVTLDCPFYMLPKSIEICGRAEKYVP